MEAAPQRGLPPISVSGKRKEKHAVKNTQPATAAPTPNAPTGAACATGTGPGGIPATSLNTVAPSASRLGLPVIETPASVDIVTARTIADQGYRTTTDTAQGAVGVLSGDAGGAPANFSMRGFSAAQ